MSRPNRPIQAEHRHEARRWLVIVEEDLDVAALSCPESGVASEASLEIRTGFLRTLSCCFRLKIFAVHDF